MLKNAGEGCDTNSMDLQNPDDWKLSLLQLPKYPIFPSQLSTSKWHVQDEAKALEYHVQSRLDLGP